jgi:putative phosphoesterase
MTADRIAIGVVSDTHGLVRPEAIAALRGCDLVLHAGDVGRPEVLDAFGDIAPTVAVRGNVDKGAWAETLPLTEVVEAGGRLLYMLHDVSDLDLDPAAAGFAAVIFGHSHRPSAERKDGVLYVNPGSAGPRRFSLPVSVARISIEGPAFNCEIITLDIGA